MGLYHHCYETWLDSDWGDSGVLLLPLPSEDFSLDSYLSPQSPERNTGAHSIVRENKKLGSGMSREIMD